MAWSADEEMYARVLSRTRATLALRQPQILYGAAAFVLQLSTGFMAFFWVSSVSPNFDAASANTLMIPAGAAALIASATVGVSLFHNEISNLVTLVLRATLVWTAITALWPLSTVLPTMFAQAGGVSSLEEFNQMFSSLAQHMLAEAWKGAIGGGAGSLAAALLCLERRA